MGSIWTGLVSGWVSRPSSLRPTPDGLRFGLFVAAIAVVAMNTGNNLLHLLVAMLLSLLVLSALLSSWCLRGLVVSSVGSPSRSSRTLPWW